MNGEAQDYPQGQNSQNLNYKDVWKDNLKAFSSNIVRLQGFGRLGQTFGEFSLIKSETI